MTQARKNAGRSGALAEEARNEPWAGAAPSKLSPGSRGAGTAGTWAGTAWGQLGDSSGTAQGRATEAAARGDPARHSGEPSARWLPAGQVASKISKTSTFTQLKGSEQRKRERYGAGRNRGAPGFPNHQRANGGDWCQPPSVLGSLQGAVWGQAVGWGGFLLNLGAYTPACHGTGLG